MTSTCYSDSKTPDSPPLTLVPLPSLHFHLSGTDQNRVFVLHIHRLEDVDDNYLVLDERGSISFATIGNYIST